MPRKADIEAFEKILSALYELGFIGTQDLKAIPEELSKRS